MCPLVTSLTAQQRRKDRYNVFLDGEYAFSLSGILALELKVGQEISAAEVAALRQREALEYAYDRALRFLSYRPRSEQEMVRYLKRIETDEAAIPGILDRLRRVGLVNDREFARFWVESRETFRPRGRYGLQSELRQKGIDREVIEEAISDLDEDDSAMRAGRRMAERLPADRELFFRRLMGRLQRRGFAYASARRVVEQLWAERQLADESNTDRDTRFDTEI